MSKRSVAIERLKIRMKGVSPEAARAAAGDLGGELMGRLAAVWQGPGPRRTGTIDHLDSGTVHVPPGATPSELRKAMAGRITDAIKSTPT